MPSAPDGPGGGPWTTGKSVVVRWRRHGGVGHVNAVTVVCDAPDVIALFQPEGAPVKRPESSDGRPWTSIPIEERAILPTWRHSDGVWRETNVLELQRPDDPYAFWVMWSAADWAFLRWYVNLQAPLERTAVGFDTRDHILDVVVDADGSWAWKDEHDFEIACRVGRFPPDEALAIRRAAREAIATIEAREWPFGYGLEDWRPDPDWPSPAIPTAWDA